jgi:hypothetical protein
MRNPLHSIFTMQSHAHDQYSLPLLICHFQGDMLHPLLLSILPYHHGELHLGQAIQARVGMDTCILLLLNSPLELCRPSLMSIQHLRLTWLMHLISLVGFHLLISMSDTTGMVSPSLLMDLFFSRKASFTSRS